MGRVSRPKDPDHFGDEVVWAWARTTAPQRRMVFEDWTQGQATYHLKVAGLLHLIPDALLLASLLEHEHPSVCFPNGRPKTKHYGQLARLMQAWAVDNSAKPVDNSQKSVDKSVDYFAFYPQVSLEPQY